MATRKNPKRLQCLKKKSKELSILCDIGVLFICRGMDASSTSSCFDSWPEDTKSCLELIDKYKKTISVKNGGSSSGSVLGKRKERSDTQEDFLHLANEKGKKIDTQMVDFLELAEKVKAGVKNLGYDELIQLLSRVDQAKMGVDQRLQFFKQELDLVSDSDSVDQRPQFVSQEFDLVSENEIVGSFDGFDLFSGNDDLVSGIDGLNFGDGFDLVSGNVVSDGLSFGDGFDLVAGNVVSDGLSFREGFDLVSRNEFFYSGPENDQDCDVNVFDIKNLEAWLNDNQEFDKDVSNTEFIAYLEEICQTLQGSNQGPVRVDDLEGDDQQECQAQNSINSNNIEILEISDTFEEKRQTLQASSQDHILVDNLEEDHQEECQAKNSINSLDNIEIMEISDTSEDEIVEISATSDDEDEDEEVELIPSSQSWLLFDFFDQLQ